MAPKNNPKAKAKAKAKTKAKAKPITKAVVKSVLGKRKECPFGEKNLVAAMHRNRGRGSGMFAKKHLVAAMHQMIKEHESYYPGQRFDKALQDQADKLEVVVPEAVAFRTESK